MTGKWRLNMGCHNGTLISRDSALPSSYDSEEDARYAYNEMKKAWRSIGYKVWYANITSPTGEEVFHDNGAPYR